jgi:hypothetical protein
MNTKHRPAESPHSSLLPFFSVEMCLWRSGE